VASAADDTPGSTAIGVFASPSEAIGDTLRAFAYRDAASYANDQLLQHRLLRVGGRQAG
jgi:hypothetical protein